MANWIDAHTHLDAEELYSNVTQVLQRAQTAGVHKILLVNSEATEESFQRTLNCAIQGSTIIRYLAFGIHPHHASQYDQNLQSLLLRFLASEKVVALGEIGLDFYYNFSPRDVQRNVLQMQLDLALQENLPVVIHCRDAYRELREILTAEKKNVAGNDPLLYRHS